MAITKIGVYRNPPEDITDFQGINELLMAYARDLGGQGMILTEWTNVNEWPKLAMGSYLFHGGASYVVDIEDHEIGEPSDGTYYLRIVASGETLAVSWISSLTGYVWNPIYNGLYHPDQSQILPYQLVVAGASREKWKITNLAQGGGFIRSNWQGAVRMESVNTGQGDFKIGQNLRPTDAVEFANMFLRGRIWDENLAYNREIINAKAGDFVALWNSASGSLFVSGTGTSSYPYTKLISIDDVPITGTIKVLFTASASGNNPYSAYVRLYKNGVAVGTEWSISSSGIVVSQHIGINKGDNIEAWAKISAGASYAYGSVNVKDLKIATLRGFSG